MVQRASAGAFFFAVLLLVVLVGCDRGTPAPPPRPPTPQAPAPTSSTETDAGRLERDLKTKVEAAMRDLNRPDATAESVHEKLSTYDWTRKQEFLLLMERQMDRISQQVDAMTIRARDSRESTNTKLKQSLDTIESKRKDTLALLRALEVGPMEEWDALREQFLGSWQELRQMLNSHEDRATSKTATAATDPPEATPVTVP